MRVGNRDISACHPARDERGYAMVVLLVSLAVMAVMMSVAMPVWKQVSQREKETELAFRGEQYARAIGLFQRKNGPGTLPPSIDALVEQRFLRKKYKDPITNNDFVPLLQGAATQQGVGTGQTPAGGTGRGGFNQPNLQQGRGGTPTGGTASALQGPEPLQRVGVRVYTTGSTSGQWTERCWPRWTAWSRQSEPTRRWQRSRLQRLTGRPLRTISTLRSKCSQWAARYGTVASRTLERRAVPLLSTTITFVAAQGSSHEAPNTKITHLKNCASSDEIRCGSLKMCCFDLRGAASRR